MSDDGGVPPGLSGLGRLWALACGASTLTTRFGCTRLVSAGHVVLVGYREFMEFQPVAESDIQSPPSTVVFDLGNVLIGWDAYLPLADRMTRDEWEAFDAEADFMSFNVLADTGVPLAEVVARAAADSPRYGEIVGAYFENFPASLTGPIPGTPAIVEELKSRGTRLLGLSNWSHETIHHAPITAPAIAELEDVVVSGREGLAKPDPRIFNRLSDRFGLDPHDTVFIDDSKPNVDAAADLGFIALHFTNAATLRAQLSLLGLLGEHNS